PCERHGRGVSFPDQSLAAPLRDWCRWSWRFNWVGSAYPNICTTRAIRGLSLYQTSLREVLSWPCVTRSLLGWGVWGWAGPASPGGTSCAGIVWGGFSRVEGARCACVTG